MSSLYNRYVPPKKQKTPPSSPAAAVTSEVPIQNASTRSALHRGGAVEASANGLYARYVPTKSPSSPSGPSLPPTAEPVRTPERKRKRNQDDDAKSEVVEAQNSNQREPLVQSQDDALKSQHHARRTSALSELSDHMSEERPQGLPTTPTTRHKKQIKSSKAATSESPRDSRQVEANRVDEQDAALDASPRNKPKKKSKHVDGRQKSAIEETDDDVSRSKSHKSVLAKFQKSASKASARINDEEDEQGEDHMELDEPPQVNELEPIPLPPSKHDSDRPRWSALPSWFSEPTTVPLDAVHAFADIGVAEKSLSLLRQQNIEKTLPIQTGVLPLLLPRPAQHPGDVCVSAATGSGKTLSYVIPIMEQLRPLPIPQLRAVIVVPTRELVNQVFATCETFAREFDLKVGTAVGNKSLKDEQSSLVESSSRYDPNAYAKIANKLKTPYGTAHLDESDLEDEEQLLGLKRHTDLLPNHVPTYFSNVDILVATPGRLVEHIRHTKGFDFSNLRWLVIDEADRLLDQSFQEWADIVDTALNVEGPDDIPVPFSFDPILKGLFLPKVRFPARKVILSATMTSDLDKLSILKLRNPKLVVVQGSEGNKEHNKGDAAAAQGEQQAIAGILTLPATLEEFAVPVGDGSEKPLYLVSLLQKIMGDDITEAKTSARPSSAEQASPRKPEPDPSSVADADSDTDTDSSSSVSSSVSSTSSSSTSDTTSTSTSTTPSPATTNPPPARSTTSPASILIFTSTNESTTRLHALLRTLLPALAPHTAALTRTTSAATAAAHLSRLRAGRLRILIASDRASRGLDVPALTDVISYDLPRGVAAYVHRVGRTARAGRAGRAWTLTERRGAGWFWHVVARGDEARAGGKAGEVRIRRGHGHRVRKVRLEEVGGRGLRARYEVALGQLKADVLGEAK